MSKVLRTTLPPNRAGLGEVVDGGQDVSANHFDGGHVVFVSESVDAEDEFGGAEAVEPDGVFD